MPGLSQYAPDPRNPALANNVMSDRDNAGLDEMLKNLDTGASAPGNMGQTREAMPQPAAQGNNPWLQWLMQYIQSKQGGQR